MKPKRFLTIPRCTPLKGYAKSTRTVKPLRYYVAGGADVDGDALKQDKRYSSDPDADSDNWMSMFGTDSDGNPIVFSDPFSDPRHDVFSIASMAGSDNFQKAMHEAMRQQQSGSTVEPAVAAASSASTGDGSVTTTN